MQNIAQPPGAFNAPNENGTGEKQLFFLTTGTRAGEPIHTVTTRNREFAYELFAAALNLDSEPDFGITKGVFFVQFFADDGECAAAIQTAQTRAALPYKAGAA